MAYEQFIDKSFYERSTRIILHAKDIIEEYRAQGFTLTLRQLYYQFVSRDLLPNKQSEYKRLGSIINDARLAGLIDWNAIEDRTRNLNRPPWWNSPKDILHSAAHSYRRNMWQNQPVYVEVWLEKEALVGVIEPACRRLRVPFFACRGYTSQSEQYNAGKRISDRINDDKRVLILHLGDHDPSGIDMTRDSTERLEMFAYIDDPSIFEFKRIALNMNQIKQYNPPANPAKDTDSRIHGYSYRYGDECWELDALNPNVIDRLIADEILLVRDDDQWAADLEIESKEIEALEKLAESWE